MPYQWIEDYRHERNTLIDGEQESEKSYDKYVLTLSGGALALSVTFIHDIIGDAPMLVPALIVLAWIAFGLSVAATLISMRLSGPLYRDFRDVLDREAQRAGASDNFLWTRVREEQSKCRHLKLPSRLSNASLFLFLAGVILLLSFIAWNPQRSNSHDRPATTATQGPQCKREAPSGTS